MIQSARLPVSSPARAMQTIPHPATRQFRSILMIGLLNGFFERLIPDIIDGFRVNA